MKKASGGLVDARGARKQAVIPPSEVKRPYVWLESIQDLATILKKAGGRPADYERRLFNCLTMGRVRAATISEGSCSGVYSRTSSSTSSYSRVTGQSDAPSYPRKACIPSSDQPSTDRVGRLWKDPAVAFLPIIKTAYRRTYGIGIPVSDTELQNGALFNDPFEVEQNPSYNLLQGLDGEWKLRSHRSRDAGGACFMTVQQAFHTMKTGTKPLRTITATEQKRLTRDLILWLQKYGEKRKAWWSSETKLGRVAGAALEEIVYLSWFNDEVRLGARLLERRTGINYRNCSPALSVLCLLGLLSRQECQGPIKGQKRGSKLYRYQILFDEAESVDRRLAELNINPNTPNSWRTAAEKNREQLQLLSQPHPP